MAAREYAVLITQMSIYDHRCSINNSGHAYRQWDKWGSGSGFGRRLLVIVTHPFLCRRVNCAYRWVIVGNALIGYWTWWVAEICGTNSWVMRGWMSLGECVGKVMLACFPNERELTLLNTIHDPPISHVHASRSVGRKIAV